ncbi:uncharacterized protein [Centruroides vittatus]|uniref:uncharacterized protein n=1 Tax=Centruroides vittatus TaxID=120091 RepID=UPI0035101861
MEQSRTVRELRQYCKDNNLRGYSRLRKADLIDFIIIYRRRGQSQTLHELRQFCRDNNLRSYSRLRKADLIDFIEKYKFSNIFNFHENVIIKPRQPREKNIFSNFHEDIITKPRKEREKQIKCDICNHYYKPTYKNLHLEKREHKNALYNGEAIQEIETAFESRLKTYSIRNMTNHIIPREFLEDVREIVIRKIAEILKEKGLKVNFKFFCEYQRENENMGFSFKTENEIILKSTDLNAFYDKVIDKLIREMDEFETKGSGWTLIEINNLELRINKYVPFRGSSYIELPKQIKDKKAVLNIKNEDEECFAYCIAAYLNPVGENNHNPGRVSNYNIKLIKEALKGIESPIALQDIGKCEKRLNISVNVYSYEEHCTKKEGEEKNKEGEEKKKKEEKKRAMKYIL